ncbi:MAG TPA: beta-ketoacyl synthase N-terminal-like domain-containing protein [Herpetosiphonaceae bacterium]
MPLNSPVHDPARELETLVHLLQWRARHQSHDTAYVFLTNGETEEDRLSYGQLDTWARAIASHLQHLNLRDERALLLFPAGLDYLAAFFGCLYAGVTAVPVYPPHPAKLERSMPRIRVMVEDAQPRIALMPAAIQPTIAEMFSRIPNFERLTCLATDTLDQRLADEWHEPPVRGDTLAFLQYTSGSTAAPRGVMVSHSNLLHNHAVIQSALQHPPDAPYLSWLPLFHDMGLIGNALQAVYTGVPCVLMAPTAFLQRPIRWLQAISRYKAATSGGPNFAYELCVRQTTPEQRDGLDLSHWKIAFNGAEPVRAETIERFTAAFKPYGFRSETLYPCYGLAESTLFVTGSDDDAGPGKGVFQSASLDQRLVVPSSEAEPQSRTLVHCGHTWLDHTVAIVNPETRRRCRPDQVGEIWVSGPSVAQGYWGYPEKSEQTFRARLADTGEGPFLRTGDLGFLYEGNLFVAGRLKDMVIIRGRNHYPQDIEATVERSHPALRAGGGAACSVEVGGEERLVIVQEVERHAIRKLDSDEVAAAIRSAVTEEHEVDVYAVVLLKTGSIPKTSSGKIQRHACRVGFLQGTLSVVGQWQQPAPADSPTTERVALPAGVASPTPSKRISVEAIQIWLANEIAAQRNIAPQDVDIWQPFANYGLTSAELVSLSGKLEEWLDRQLSPTLLYDYPTIGALAGYLTQRSDVTERAAGERLAETEAIAIVGLGCRLPGADSPAAFWELLLSGGDAITEVPAQRWDADAFYAAESRPGKMNTRRGAFLADVDQFDAGFFGLAPREVEQMDPQQRLLLEVAWEALEHAGIAPGRLAGQPVGVFIGISNNDYARIPGDPLSADTAYAGTGNALSIAANRLSYALDLRGPALAVDTACSSSLVAVHLACESLRRGESELALVGGVNLILTPDVSVTLSQAQMLSPDGRCKTFDAQANGYVRGEGCGVVVLKPLSAALRDGDAILAQIKGSAVNQDGRSNGLTAPSGLAQQAVIRQALENAGVDPAQVSYIEAHGSGTALGDPIEINALKAALMQGRTLADRCWIGSVKTNIGHLEAAAGIAGLIKTTLALHHGMIPPHLHLTTLNPHITLDDTSFAIPTGATPWTATQRLAGVSSFGFGGTNAHVVLAAAPEHHAPADDRQQPVQLLTLSARDDQALATLAARYHDFLVAYPDLSLADLCFTAGTGRTHFSQRLALIAESLEQAREQLAAFSAGQSADTMLTGKAGRKPLEIAFLFTGQGAQYADMGRTLYETAPVFRQALDECDAILRPYLPQPLLSVIYPAAAEQTLLDETAFTQPALFAVEYALARLWQSWGVTPSALLGHSVGEYVAATIAGIFSLEDGLRLIVERARLMQALPSDGQMVAVFAAESDVAAAVAPYADSVAIAAINGPKHCVISGSTRAIEQIGARLSGQGVKVTPLKVSHAFHSPLMQPMLDAFAQVAQSVRYNTPQLPIISNVTGAVVSDEMSTAGYWVDHVRRPVRFAAGMDTLRSLGYRVFLEVGPHPVLISMGQQSLEDDRAVWLPSLRRTTKDWQQILHSLGSLYVQGLAINWLDFEQHARRRVRLPTYPWQRQRYWREPAPAADPARPQPRAASGSTATARHPLLGVPLPPLAHEPDTYVWDLDLTGSQLAYFDDHQIGGATVVPVSAYIEMALGAAAEVFGTHTCHLSDLALHQPLFLSSTQPRTLQVSMTQDGAGRAHFRVYGRATHAGATRQPWILHASAVLDPVAEPAAMPAR